MTVNQVHAEYILNFVTNTELSQQIEMMFGNIWLLVVIGQAIVPLRRIGQSRFWCDSQNKLSRKRPKTRTYCSKPLGQKE